MWTDNVFPASYGQILSRSHILIAGATGSGKSVLLNGLIATAAVKRGTFIFIDPKMVELSQWRGLCSAKLVYAYADSVESSVEALQKAVNIINSRYKDCRKRGLVKTDADPVYVCIDELADLMTTAKKQALPLLQRILMVGRGANVHLIGCTQTVKADVLSTNLTANFTCRICLHTATAHHSRMVIGQTGGELLPNPTIEHRAEMLVSSEFGLNKYDIPMITGDDIAHISRVMCSLRKKRFSWKKALAS